MIENLKMLREEKGLSQQKLADILGVSQQSIYKYETQDVEPDIAMLKKMAAYFETSLDFLVGHSSIRRAVVAYKPYDLNQEEATLVDHFRALPASSRKVIEDLIHNMLSNK